MSFDRQIDFVCPHMVAEEALFLNVDRVTVRPLRPVSSVNSVKVRVNGEIQVPSHGVHLPAEALAGKKAPFNIRTGTNDTLIIKVGDATERTIQVPPGENLSSREVARRLSQGASDVTFDVSPKGRFRIQTRSMGRAATLIVRPTALATTLGLPINRQWRGVTPFPGWSMIADSKALLERPSRLIVFDAPLKGTREYVELSYATLRQECRRCGGLGVENDWRYGANGGVIEVRNEALLIQEVQKITYTAQGTNPFHEWYGTNILNTIGKKLSSSGLVQSFIITDIREAFRRWQNIKKQQEEIVGQVVTDEEYPFRLVSVKLDQSQEDPTVVFVTASIQSRSQKPIQIERGVRLPLPADIMGSSTQDGIIRQSLRDYTLTR